MQNLLITNDLISSGYQPYILDILSFNSILSGILVIVSLNPVISVLYLICLFVNLACYIILLGLNFIGLTYILVYVGAIAILFLYIIMLLNIKLSELQTKDNNNLPLGFIIGIMFVVEMYLIISKDISKSANEIFQWIISNITNIGSINSDIIIKNTKLYNVHNVVWDSNIVTYSQISSIGNIMYTNYGIWILLTSLILLLAMVGAISLTIKPNQFNH